MAPPVARRGRAPDDEETGSAFPFSPRSPRREDVPILVSRIGVASMRPVEAASLPSSQPPSLDLFSGTVGAFFEGVRATFLESDALLVVSLECVFLAVIPVPSAVRRSSEGRPSGRVRRDAPDARLRLSSEGRPSGRGVVFNPRLSRDG